MTKKRINSSWWHRLFSLLMALYVLNVSVDAPDGYVAPNANGEYQEDLSINEIESIAELVLEHWFDLHDAVPEHDEPEDDEGGNQLTKLFFDWSIPSPTVCYQFVGSENFPLVMYFPAYVNPCYRFCLAKINTPPPQFV